MSPKRLDNIRETTLGTIKDCLVVGITGGIGSGKSTIAHLYELMGYPIYKADDRAKWLMNNSPEIKSKLIKTFGNKVYEQGLSRQALASIVFNNQGALDKLNSIVHPIVKNDFIEWRDAQVSPIIFKEAAILFESGTHTSVDKVICATAPLETRIKWVMKRDGATREEVLARINKQWPDDKKIELSDYIIESGTPKLVIPQALSILQKLTK